MSQKQSFIQLPLVAVVLFSLLVGVYLLIGRRPAKRKPVGITKHTVETSADDTLKYWTAEKMRHARPADMPNVDDLEHDKQHPRRPRG